MVKLRGPLYSFFAAGWLGRYTYGRIGLVRCPYPIAFFNAYLQTGFYYSKYGWCYQTRRTWHGLQPVAMHPPISEGTNTLERQVWRTAFKDAVSEWQGLTGLEKGIWNSYSYPKLPAGYGRFIGWYLGKIKNEMPISPTNVIDHFDQSIHDGEVHVISLISGEIAQAAVFYLLIKCHADFSLHCVMSFDSEGEWHREIYEDPTITDNGAALTPRNRNRNNADGVNATFFSGPTIGADGTLLVERVMGSGKDEAGNGTTAEWVLKKGENYLLKMVNDAGANKHASMRIMFTEED